MEEEGSSGNGREPIIDTEEQGTGGENASDAENGSDTGSSDNLEVAVGSMSEDVDRNGD